MADAAQSDEPDLSGQVLDGRYKLVRLLGIGGMGVVYESQHVTLPKRAAVKVLKQEFAHKEAYRQRFLREARAAAIIAHRNVVEIVDFGQTPAGSPYFVMEFLDGPDLKELIEKEGRMPWRRARGLLLQATEALKAAHRRRVIHRDIKPSNVVVLKDDSGTEQVKLLDFGIAKMVENSESGKKLTGTGEVFGSAAYMAPEQAFGEPADARTDVYSVAIMAYEMLTGRVPFDGVNAFHILTRHQNEAPKPPREIDASIPDDVEAVILKALEKSPDDRYQTMAELDEALRAIPVGRVGSLRTAPRPQVEGPKLFDAPPEFLTGGHGAQRSLPDLGGAPAGATARLPEGASLPSRVKLSHRVDGGTSLLDLQGGGVPDVHPTAPLPQLAGPRAPEPGSGQETTVLAAMVAADGSQTPTKPPAPARAQPPAMPKAASAPERDVQPTEVEPDFEELPSGLLRHIGIALVGLLVVAAGVFGVKKVLDEDEGPATAAAAIGATKDKPNAPREAEAKAEPEPDTGLKLEPVVPEVPAEPEEEPPEPQAPAEEVPQPVAPTSDPTPKPTAKGKPKSNGSQTPKAPTDESIIRGLKRKIAKQCGAKSPGSTLKVQATILSKGRAAGTKVSQGSAAAQACAKGIVDAASFPAGEMRAASFSVGLGG